MTNGRAQSSMSFSSAETIGSDLDVLSEILQRVPATALLKFKCVSKLWLSLISDPIFCFSHARLQKLLDPTPSALLLNQSFSSTCKFHRVPLENDRDAVLMKIRNLDYLNDGVFKIMRSCNGLLLCSSNDEKKADCEKKFFVCNPTTKQFKALSFPFAGNANDLFLSLAFDPVKSPHYKVLSVRVLDLMGDRYLFDLYSSENDSWNNLQTPIFKIPWGIKLDAGVFCNGSIHWYSCGKTSLYFDFDCKTFKILPMPCLFFWDERSVCDILYFGESRERLHTVGAQKGSVLEFDVLQLAPDYSGWFLRYHVDLRSIRAASPDFWPLRCRQFSILSLVEAEKEDQSFVVIFVYGKAMSYNLSKGTTINLCDLWQRPKIFTDEEVFKKWLSGRKYYEWRDAYDYIESLTCI